MEKISWVLIEISSKISLFLDKMKLIKYKNLFILPLINVFNFTYNFSLRTYVLKKHYTWRVILFPNQKQ